MLISRITLIDITDIDRQQIGLAYNDAVMHIEKSRLNNDFIVPHCFVRKDSESDVEDVDVDACNSHDILAKLVETGCKADWTAFKDIYAAGSGISHFTVVVFSGPICMSYAN